MRRRIPLFLDSKDRFSKVSYNSSFECRTLNVVLLSATQTTKFHEDSDSAVSVTTKYFLNLLHLKTSYFDLILDIDFPLCSIVDESILSVKWIFFNDLFYDR